MSVSARGIVLTDAHFVPLFDAPAIFPLDYKRINTAMKVNLLHLVLFLVPPPHGTEQEVHDPHGLTSQSTKREFVQNQISYDFV